MLRINRRTDYAVRVMVSLAKKPDGVRIPSMEIQREMLVPHAFLQRIIADLAHSRLVSTVPGPNGGIQLSRDKDSITLLDIYEAIEGPLFISNCLQSPKSCALNKSCPVHPRWRRMQEMLVNELALATLSDLEKDAYELAAAQKEPEEQLIQV